MSSTREYGAAIFSPGLGEVLLIRHGEDAGWSFPFANTNESDVHVVAAASAVRHLLGIDIGDKICRMHWIEIDFPQTGSPVRLYMALGVRPDSVTPRCAPGASAQWHPLRAIFPPVNAILRADHGGAGAGVSGGRLNPDGGQGEQDVEDGGGDLMLEAGIAPFLAKMKALLDKHPEWRIAQLDPRLTRLIQAAITLPPQYHQQHQHQGQQQQHEDQTLVTQPDSQLQGALSLPESGQPPEQPPLALPPPPTSQSQESLQQQQEPPSPSAPQPQEGTAAAGAPCLPGPEGLQEEQQQQQEPPPAAGQGQGHREALPDSSGAVAAGASETASPATATADAADADRDGAVAAGGLGALSLSGIKEDPQEEEPVGPTGPVPSVLAEAQATAVAAEAQATAVAAEAPAEQEQAAPLAGPGEDVEMRPADGEGAADATEGVGQDSAADAAAQPEAGAEAGAAVAGEPEAVAEPSAAAPGVEGREAGEEAGSGEEASGGEDTAAAATAAAAADLGGAAGGGEAEGEGEGEGEGDAGLWKGPRPQEHLLAYCRLHQLPEPCYSLVVKKSARRPLVTASCILPHLGVQVTPDMHVPGGMHAACQAAALVAILWLEGALPPDGGEVVRVVPVGWPPLLSEARGESWEAAQAARRAGARRELDLAQREALLREMDKKRQRLVAEAAELERLMAALRGGEAVPEPDLTRLTASLGLGGGGGEREGEGLLQAGGAADGAIVAALPAGRMGSAGDASDGTALGGGGGGSMAGLAGSVTVGMRALQFRSGSESLPGGATPGSASRGGGGGRGAQGRAPGTKRPREDGHVGGGASESTPGPGSVKSVVMELKELCDRRRWPQPQYAFNPASPGTPGAGATAVLTLPPVTGLGAVSSGLQSNRKRAKEAAAAAALAQLSALGLK